MAATGVRHDGQGSKGYGLGFMTRVWVSRVYESTGSRTYTERVAATKVLVFMNTGLIQRLGFMNKGLGFRV